MCAVPNMAGFFCISLMLFFRSIVIIIIIIIIIIVIFIPVITFMQAIYNYIPDTNPVSTVRSVAAVLYLHSVLHVMLFGT
jgi:hypothetical protein